jgi:hypothetical protein
VLRVTVSPRFGGLPDPALLRAELGRVLDGTLALGEALARKERDYAPVLPPGRCRTARVLWFDDEATGGVVLELRATDRIGCCTAWRRRWRSADAQVRWARVATLGLVGGRLLRLLCRSEDGPDRAAAAGDRVGGARGRPLRPARRSEWNEPPVPGVGECDDCRAARAHGTGPATRTSRVRRSAPLRLHLPGRTLLLVAGMPGAGKSTLLASLPGSPELVVLDSDEHRLALARRLPGIAYRRYRPLVHLRHRIAVVRAAWSATPTVVVHLPATDAATRPGRPARRADRAHRAPALAARRSRGGAARAARARPVGAVHLVRRARAARGRGHRAVARSSGRPDGAP